MMACVMEMAHTRCLLQPLLQPAVDPNEPLCCCHNTVPSISMMTLPSTALCADFPWSSQRSREGMWERMSLGVPVPARFHG